MRIHKKKERTTFLKQAGFTLMILLCALLLAYTLQNNIFTADYQGEERDGSLFSAVTKLMLNVDFREPTSILVYQLHDFDTARTSRGYEITPNGEIVYDGTRVLSEVIDVEIKKIKDEWQPAPPKEDKRPLVYIYHTHTHEAYDPAGYDYREVERWRTKDNDYNVVAVGTALTSALEELGISVIHDTTDFELNDYGGAYPRSLSALKKVKTEYDPAIYIDLHRNAYFENAEKSRAFSFEGQSMAYMMCVIGTGEKTAEKPQWRENYKLARKLTDEMNAQAPGICYEPSVWEGRYNQHISTDSVLIEVGHNLNTIDEAKRSMTYLAKAIQCALES
ncbi:MAG: stage II sporulation protein P [Eubacteriales bacterium]|nr:stage II sporulation protein P [Eubacteriales bacterium]